MRADSEGGGILFYIIVAIVGFILSLLQKKAKPTDNNPIPKDTWEDFPDFDDTNTTVEPEPISSKKTASPKPFIENIESVEASTKLEDIISDNPFYHSQHEGTRVYEYTDEIKRTEIGNFEDNQSTKVTFEFNPKLAVIYSEILNRKYI